VTAKLQVDETPPIWIDLENRVQRGYEVVFKVTFITTPYLTIVAQTGTVAMANDIIAN
jgi:hypothetical protein